MLEIKQKPHLHATWIDPQAVEIVERLQRAGYKSFLVGGCVRDLLTGIHPKDYDIATNASPNEIRKKVWGSYVIGRRFRLVLAKRGDQQFEIATFRRASKPEDFIEGEEAPFGDNFFGTEEEDALRRDFTINALFYDPVKSELLDYAEGVRDIDARTIRMIGDPAGRVIDDPIRSLRAVRLAHKLHFQIESNLRTAIREHACEVAKSPLPRRREEYLKFLRLEDPMPALCELFDLHLMEHLLPSLHQLWQEPERLDIFSIYMRRAGELIRNSKNPMEVYLPLLLAFDHAFLDMPDLDDRREKFMRNELGMFKSESADILNIFDLAQNLPQVALFKKRGQRRQTAFFNQEFLPPALRVARMELTTTVDELSFWEAAAITRQR